MTRLVTVLLAVMVMAGPALADPVDNAVERYRTAAHIPGAAVAIVEGGRIATLRAYGSADLETGAPVTADTAFQTASASKIFTGVLLMRLVERGVIDLDAPITDYLPDAPTAWREVTFRRLATHASGLPEGLGLPQTATSAEIAAAAMTRPLAYRPGSQSRYGFTDFIVLAAALERVAGAPFADLLRREIIVPLGLTNTGFDFATPSGPAAAAGIGERATIYVWDGRQQFVDSFLYPINGYSAGGIYTSARDFATLLAAIQAGGFLGPDSFRQLTTAAMLDTGRPGDFAIGWTARTYRGEPVYGHSGGPALADVMVVPGRDLAIVVLANQRRFFPLIAEAIADTQWPAPTPRTAVADTAPELADDVGRVLHDAGTGSVDTEAFSEAGSNAREFLNGFGSALLSAVGPVKSIDLLSDADGEAGRRRVYRVRFEARDMIWTATTDEADRFIELRPGSEAD